MSVEAIPLLPCLYHQLFGISCPVCGMQRSVLLLLEGKVGLAVVQFPPLPLLIITPILLAIIFLRHQSLRKTRWLGITWLIALVINCLYQNFLSPL